MTCVIQKYCACGKDHPSTTILRQEFNTGPRLPYNLHDLRPQWTSLLRDGHSQRHPKRLIYLSITAAKHGLALYFLQVQTQS